jgi:hypothetical protein
MTLTTKPISTSPTPISSLASPTPASPTPAPFPIITDRSRIEDFQTCPRYRWWTYEFGNLGALDSDETGVVSNQISMYLLTGIGVHAGAELINREAAGKPGEWRASTDLIQRAVRAAHDAYWNELKYRGLQVGPKAGESPAAVEWIKQEQAALVEAQVWLYGIFLVPSLIEQYEILAVESDLLAQLEPAQFNVWLIGKPDCILRNRETGDVHALSLKTAGEISWYTDYNFTRDLQGVTESYIVDKNGYEQVAGSQMLYLVKGRRYEDKAAGDGRKITYNPLISAFKLRGPTQSEDQWRWKNEFDKTDKEGRVYQGRLGKEWVRTPVWDPHDGFPGGVGAWIQYLMSGNAEPGGDPFEGLWYMPQAQLFRDPELGRRRIRQIAIQERQVAQWSLAINRALEKGEDIESPKIQAALDYAFRQQTQSCERMGGTCDCDALCFGSGGEGQLAGKIGEFYQPRTSHHPRSVEIRDRVLGR